MRRTIRCTEGPVISFHEWMLSYRSSVIGSVITLGASMKLVLRDLVWSILTIALSVGLACCYIQMRESSQTANVLRRQVDELETKSHQLSEKNIEIVTNMTRLTREMQERAKKASEKKERNANSARETKMADFFAVRGFELMKLERYAEAAASFEIAFRNQPNNVVFIDKLIDCYAISGNNRQAEAYERRLAKVLDKFKNGGWHHEPN